MTDTVLDDALTIMASGAADELRTWAGIPWLMGVARLVLAVRSISRVCQVVRLTPTLVVVPLCLVAWMVLGTDNGHAASPPPSRSAEVWSVDATFREAFQLWADERFDALWERGLLTSRYRVSREAFVRGMRHRRLKPTCCWGQLRSVQVSLPTAEEALVEAQVGVDMKTLGTTEVRHMLVYLRREEGVWRVALEDFLTRPEEGPFGLGWLR
jgi:hypothetical protein